MFWIAKSGKELKNKAADLVSDQGAPRADLAQQSRRKGQVESLVELNEIKFKKKFKEIKKNRKKGENSRNSETKLPRLPRGHLGEPPGLASP